MEEWERWKSVSRWRGTVVTRSQLTNSTSLCEGKETSQAPSVPTTNSMAFRETSSIAMTTQLDQNSPSQLSRQQTGIPTEQLTEQGWLAIARERRDSLSCRSLATEIELLDK